MRRYTRAELSFLAIADAVCGLLNVALFLVGYWLLTDDRWFNFADLPTAACLVVFVLAQSETARNGLRP